MVFAGRGRGPVRLAVGIGDPEHERQMRGPAGELIPSVDELTNDSAWDVLAVLAASPEGTIGTAELLERMWPGTPRPAADNALRASLQALHRLLSRAAPGLQGEVIALHLATPVTLKRAWSSRMCTASCSMLSELRLWSSRILRKSSMPAFM